MAETNPEIIDFFLRENCGKMTVRELAEATGFSRSAMERRLKKLGLKTKGAAGHSAKAGQAGQTARKKRSAEQDGESEIERLEEARDILHGLLIDANAANAARISSEYRAVLERIGQIRAQDEADDEAEGFDDYR